MATEQVSRNPYLPYMLLVPACIPFLMLFLSAILMLRISFGEQNHEWNTWSLESYAALFDVSFGMGLLRSIRLTVIATVAAITLSLPLSMLYASTQSRLGRRFLLLLVLLPLFVSQLLQSYGWIVMLGPAGLVNRILVATGIIAYPMRILYAEIGVIFGMVQMALPLAVLPIASALRNIPPSLEEAASVLGARRLRILWEIVLPMARPGIWAAVVTVTAFNISAFVVPLLLGGGRVTTVPIMIREQMGPLLNWPQGAAFAVVLVFVALAAMQVLLIIRSRRGQP
ncbi:ABC transporter permease [Rhizobium sp. LEGMi135b]